MALGSVGPGVVRHEVFGACQIERRPRGASRAGARSYVFFGPITPVRERATAWFVRRAIEPCAKAFARKILRNNWPEKNVGASASSRCAARAALDLVSAMLLEQNDKWCLQRRYMQLEAFEAVSDNPQAKLSAVINYTANSAARTMMSYTTSRDTILDGVAIHLPAFWLVTTNPAFIAGQLGHSVQVLLSTYAKWLNSANDWAELAKLEKNVMGTEGVQD